MKLKNILQKMKGAEIKKILHNINWLAGEQAIKMGIGMIVTVFVARYLGPDKFGLMNYAVAFVGLFLAFNQLGLEGIAVRNIVNNPVREREYLGSSLLLRIVGSLFLMLFSVLGITLLCPENSELHILVLIIGLSHFFRSFETVDFWFQAHVKSRYTVYARTIAVLLILGLKLIFVITAQPLIAFVYMFALDTFIAAIFLVILYQKNGSISIFKWKCNFKTIKELLKDSWPLIFGGVAVAIYMKIDQVMIGSMLSDKDVGLYSAAVQLSKGWHFLPIIITGSMFPSILKIRKQSNELYMQKMQFLYDGFTWFTIVIAFVVMIFANFIVSLIYGPEFVETGKILSIHVWSGVFVFLGVASYRYLVAENLTKISLYRPLLGAVVNIVLNLLLIPRYGVMGATVGTLISYVVSTMSIFLFKKSRVVGMQLVNSFNIVRIIKWLLHSKKK